MTDTQITKLSKILSRFFCPNRQINWKTLTRPWSEGGFQLPDIIQKVRRIQGKLANRLYSGRNQPWKISWRKGIHRTANTADPRILFHALLEPEPPPRDPPNIPNPWASTPHNTKQITFSLSRISPLLRQSLQFLHKFSRLKNHPNPHLTLDQVLALPATPSKIFNSHTNRRHTRDLVKSNHVRINDLFNEDDHRFFTDNELATAANIQPHILAPLITQVKDNLPPPWLHICKTPEGHSHPVTGSC